MYNWRLGMTGCGENMNLDLKNVSSASCSGKSADFPVKTQLFNLHKKNLNRVTYKFTGVSIKVEYFPSIFTYCLHLISCFMIQKVCENIS